MTARRSIPTSRRRSRRPGFTLVEVLVVLVLVALLAAMVVPRLGGMERRRYRLTVDRIEDMMLMVAQRSSLGSRPIGITRDEDARGRARLLLVVQEREADDAATAEWVPDPLTPPVVIDDIVGPAYDRLDGNLQISADGEVLDVREWPLVVVPGERRPNIEIRTESPDGTQRSELVLREFAMLAERRDSSGAPGGFGLDRGGGRETVDLDAAGRSEEDW